MVLGSRNRGPDPFDNGVRTRMLDIQLLAGLRGTDVLQR